MSKQTTTTFPKWIEAEIDIATKSFFRNPNKICGSYWPRPLRDLIAKILTVLLNPNAQLILDSYQLSDDQMEQLILLNDKMVKPTCTYLSKYEREAARDILMLVRRPHLH